MLEDILKDLDRCFNISFTNAALSTFYDTDNVYFASLKKALDEMQISRLLFIRWQVKGRSLQVGKGDLITGKTITTLGACLGA